MRRRTIFWDWFGWVVEKLFIKLTISVFCLVLLAAPIIGYFRGTDGTKGEVGIILNRFYELLIVPNIGTITTIAAVFIGIYVTVFSVLGSIKANSIIGYLTSDDLKQLLVYSSSALIGSIVMLFYSLLYPVIASNYFRAFFFFLLLIYMLLTAVRFFINILVIYIHDINRLISNIEAEKLEIENNKHVMYLLNKFLEEKELEAMQERSKATMIKLNQKKSD